MKFTTESGSFYELDLAGRRMRRLEGKGPPTPRMGADGGWRDYLVISFPCVGARLLVSWCYLNGVVQCTTTSPITRLDTTEEDNEFMAQMALSLGQSQNSPMC